MIADWTRLQRQWKKISEASRKEICDYYESLIDKEDESRSNWDSFGELIFNKS